MARTTVLLEDHTQALLAALNTTTLVVGDGEAPRNVDKSEIPPPYIVLYPLVGGDQSGPLSDSQVDVILPYQITAVGTTRQQAQVALDIARDVMKKENITIPNRSVMDLRLLNPISGHIRDDDLPNPLHYGYDRYELETTPA